MQFVYSTFNAIVTVPNTIDAFFVLPDEEVCLFNAFLQFFHCPVLAGVMRIQLLDIGIQE